MPPRLLRCMGLLAAFASCLPAARAGELRVWPVGSNSCNTEDHERSYSFSQTGCSGNIIGDAIMGTAPPTVYSAGWVPETGAVSQSHYCVNGVMYVSTYLGSANCAGVAYIEQLTAGNVCTLSQNGVYLYRVDCSAAGQAGRGFAAVLAVAVMVHLSISPGE